MATAVATTRSQAGVAGLGRLSQIALIGIAALLLYVMSIIGELIPPIAVFAALAFVFVGLIAVGWRWAPALSALYSALFMMANGENVIRELDHPDSPIFVPAVLFLGLATVALVAGVGATIQNYSPASERKVPTWLWAGLAIVVGISVGASVMGKSLQGSSAAGISPETLAALPALTTKNFAFDQTELRVKAGELVVLRLENTDQAPHSFDVDELGVHASMPVGQNNVAIFKPTKPGTYTFYCAPHYDKATGEGMKGTLIVE